MCVSFDHHINGVEKGDHWVTTNGSIIEVTGDSYWRTTLWCKVVASTDRRFPIGHKFKYENSMGHVACGGNSADNQHSCIRHPLDAKFEIETIQQMAREMARITMLLTEHGKKGFSERDAEIERLRDEHSKIEAKAKEIEAEWAAEKARMEAEIVALKAKLAERETWPRVDASRDEKDRALQIAKFANQ